jgi:hypothetical protein
MMKQRDRLVLAGHALLLVLVLHPPVARAQDPLEGDLERPAAQVDDWGLAITPYAWFAAQSTDVGGQAIRQSFNDLASITNLGFQARVLARWRWVRFAADWTYSDMETNQDIGRIQVNQQVNQHILDMKLGGKVYDSRTEAQDRGIGIWVAAGARYWDSKVDLLLTREPILPGDPVQDTVSTGQAWWDPVLGLTLHFPVTPVVSFLVRATGGGLGIGNASSYLWDAEFAALFRVSRRLMVSAGYRQFKYDRTDGEGEDAVEQTVSVVGPAVGLSIGIF